MSKTVAEWIDELDQAIDDGAYTSQLDPKATKHATKATRGALKQLSDDFGSLLDLDAGKLAGSVDEAKKRLDELNAAAAAVSAELAATRADLADASARMEALRQEVTALKLL